MHGSTSSGPPDDDNGKEEDDNEVEDNNEVKDNDKDDNKDKGVSALGLDRDLRFSLGHQTRPNQTIRANFRRFAETRADSHKLRQILTNSRRFAQIRTNSRRNPIELRNPVEK